VRAFARRTPARPALMLLCRAVEIAECALALALQREALPPLGRAGGVLTPASALGNVLVRRLEATGRFEFASEVIAGDGHAGSA
jgi:short subunit dehydrogenase-like uncharacterized protein